MSFWVKKWRVKKFLVKIWGVKKCESRNVGQEIAGQETSMNRAFSTNSMWYMYCSHCTVLTNVQEAYFFEKKTRFGSKIQELY